MDDVFSADGMPLLDPSPDEEAWEAFLDFAFDRIGGVDANGVTNPQIRLLEKAIGMQLPFEIGLFIVMGVPNGDDWFRWSDEPDKDLATWQSAMVTRFVDDIVGGDADWPTLFGARPNGDKAAAQTIRDALQEAPQLLPLWGDLAVPTTVARGESSSDANPILSVRGAQVRLVAADLAVWLHERFQVPLPMWPETPPRHFPIWSELASRDRS